MPRGRKPKIKVDEPKNTGGGFPFFNPYGGSKKSASKKSAKKAMKKDDAS